MLRRRKRRFLSAGGSAEREFTRRTRENIRANWKPWLLGVALIVGAVVYSFYLARVQELQQRWRDRLAPRNPRSDSATWLIIDLLPAHPIISVPVAAEATGRSRPVVGQAVDQLVDAGVLVPLTTGTRNRQWEAAGLLDLAAEFEDVGPR